SVTGSVYTNKTGTYILTYQVVDSSGNQATAERTVHVVDQEEPILSLLGSAYLKLEVGTPFIDPGATATDNLDGNISNQIIVSGLVDVNQLGTYILEYVVADSEGNEAVPVTRTVEIV